jgi:hypothetical protein
MKGNQGNTPTYKYICLTNGHTLFEAEDEETEDVKWNHKWQTSYDSSLLDCYDHAT